MLRILFLDFIVLSGGLVLADDWTLYRGDAEATGQVADGKTLADNFKIAWEYRLEKGFFQATPIIADNTVFIGSSDDGMSAFNLQTGGIRWQCPIPNEVLASAAYFDGSVFVGDAAGILYALDAKTGKIRWQFDTKATIDNSPNIDVKNRRVIIGSQHGTFFALETATGKTAWEYKTEDQIRCFPSITGRNCFAAGCDSHLHVVDLDSGKGTAMIPLGSQTGSTPLLFENYAFFGTEGNEFLAVDWKEQKIVWRFPLKQSIRSPAAYRKETVIFGGLDKTVYALDKNTGKERWQFKTKGRIEGGAVIVGDRVYVPSGDSSLYILDFQSGKKIGAIELPGKLLASPAVVGHRILIATDEGVLVCLEAERN